MVSELDGSDISILYEGTAGSLDTEIGVGYGLIASAEFESAANATPGMCQIVFRDIERELNFITGRRLKLLIDGQPMWSGFVLNVGKGYAFPAGDGARPGTSKPETRVRQWTLRGMDNNTLWDRRILYNKPGDVKKAIPDITINTMDGAILRRALAQYTDWPSYIGRTDFIDDVRVPASDTLDSDHPWGYVQVGSKVRAVPEDLALWSGAVFYIGPDDEVHYHALQSVESPWGFSDRPNYQPLTGAGGFEGSYWGFREVDGSLDGGQFATDAFVWGGGAPVTTTVKFARATDPALEAIHGKWQWSETHFGEKNFKTQENVTIRSNMIVFGNPTGDDSPAQPGSVAGEGPRGLRYDQPGFSFAWHNRNVPFLSGVRRHLRPGDIVPIQLWGFSPDGGTTPYTKILPLRKVTISFPAATVDPVTKEPKTHVRFSGYFDLRNDDPFALWKYLRNRQARNVRVVGGATSADDGAPYGTTLQMTPPNEAIDGVNTVFTFSFASAAPASYVPGTSSIVLDGSTKHAGATLDYDESDPENGQVTFHTAPTGTTMMLRATSLG